MFAFYSTAWGTLRTHTSKKLDATLKIYEFNFILEVCQVDLLVLGALQQPFLPLIFWKAPLGFGVPHDNLQCNDGVNDSWCY
jgi:hypothetical protein